MNENKVLKVKSLLYNVDIDETKKAIFQIQDQEILYMYTYNYNWDNGFVIPQIILDNKKCDLSIALLIFYRVDGLRYLTNKSDNEKLSHWFSFIKKLYYTPDLSSVIPANSLSLYSKAEPIFLKHFSEILGYILLQESDFTKYSDVSDFLSNRINNLKENYTGYF